MLTLCVSLAVSVTVVLFFRFLNKQHNSPIFGVYQQRNKYYCLKFVLMYIVLGAKQLIAYLKRRVAIELGRSDDGTVHVHKQDAVMEEKYYLGDHPKAVDGVYFNGMSKDGSAVICAVARRPNRVCDAFLYLRMADGEVFLLPSLPDTYLQQNSNEQEYKVEGISLVNFIPMRAWNVSYNGEMKSRDNPEKRLKVEINLIWSAEWPCFHFDNHLSIKSMASSVAREPWSFDYFKLLKKFHQTHYEQMGCLKGELTIDGNTHVLNMPSVRDHSFGPYRDWSNFHRYVLHFIFLENGDSIAVGVVSQPLVLSHLTIGYVCYKSDPAVRPIASSDFRLYQHGENQIMPKDYGFTFCAGGQTYAVKVQVKDEESFYIGKERVAKLYERWCDVEVNGIKGVACSEWHYNNVQTGTIERKQS